MNYRVRWANLPLTVYREVAAHLRQVDGVETELVPQTSSQFDYTQSQIDSLWVRHTDPVPATVSARVQEILAYYGDRYGAWETVDAS